MPTLKQLNCEVEWGTTKTPFPEYGTTYGDGVVETYIAIPDHPQSFAVHLTSKNYIAEGLAMVVFMDGDYQANRNRLNLKYPSPGAPRNRTEIDLRVRQKEKSLGDGAYLGRAWRFDKHNIVPLDQLPSHLDRQHFDELGKICVFVLRCRAKDDGKPKSITSSSDVDDSVMEASQVPHEIATEESTTNESREPTVTETEQDLLPSFMMMDGATETHHFGLDGEGPGSAEQRAWTWNTPYPPYPPYLTYPPISAGYGPPAGNVPGHPPLPQAPSYGDYGHPPAFSHSGQPGPTVGQDEPINPRPQRRVHFNDQIPHQPSGQRPTSQEQSAKPTHQNAAPPLQPSPQPNASNYDRQPQPGFPPQPQNYGPLPDAYANYYWSAGAVPGGQDQSRAYPAHQGLNYPPPLPTNQRPGYGGFPGYPGWQAPAYPSPYIQPSWPAQPGPSSDLYTQPAVQPPLQQYYPYPYPQSAYPGARVAHLPPPTSNHPGGGVWGPPPSNAASPDQTQEEADQVDGQGGQNPGNVESTGEQSHDDREQGWGADTTTDAQAGDSSRNETEDTGGKTDTWNEQNTQPSVAPIDWNLSGASTGQADNADSSSWNAQAGPSIQAQATPSDAPPVAPVVLRQQPVQPVSSHGHARPLYGPYGPYYDTRSVSMDSKPRPDAEEEPPYDVPADNPTTHQVKPGEGYTYVHKRRSPDYIDTLEEPFARFVFKYRTKEQIESETGIKIDGEPTADEEKMKLQLMGKDKLVEMLLRTRVAAGGSAASLQATAIEADKVVRDGGVEPAAVPAPTYRFLGYDLPTARRPKTDVPSMGDLCRGALPPGAAPAAVNGTPDWEAGNSNNWHGASAVPAAVPVAHQQQQQMADPWAVRPAAPGPAFPNTAASDHKAVDSWGPPIRPAQSQPQAQVQHQQPPQQPPQQPQQQPQPQAPVAPIQFDNAVQTYKPQRPVAAPVSKVGANGRPITPPGGYGNPQGAHTAESSPSDNGMAGWEGEGAMAANNTGGGWDATGAGVAQASNPVGGW